ncbi:hypothetical protein CBL_00427 [Carabus blaptoides fortunei]
MYSITISVSSTGEGKTQGPQFTWPSPDAALPLIISKFFFLQTRAESTPLNTKFLPDAAFNFFTKKNASEFEQPSTDEQKREGGPAGSWKPVASSEERTRQKTRTHTHTKASFKPNRGTKRNRQHDIQPGITSENHGKLLAQLRQKCV